MRDQDSRRLSETELDALAERALESNKITAKEPPEVWAARLARSALAGDVGDSGQIAGESVALSVHEPGSTHGQDRTSAAESGEVRRLSEAEEEMRNRGRTYSVCECGEVCCLECARCPNCRGHGEKCPLKTPPSVYGSSR